MDNYIDIATFCFPNALNLRVIFLLLQRIITEQSFYYGKTDKHNERKKTRCRH